MEAQYFTKVEIEIQNFIEKYGVDALIKWLSEYSKIVSQSDFNMFHRIQKITCEEYNIPIADISRRKTTNRNHSDAIRTISYLASKKTKLKIKHLVMVQGCTLRTVYNHIDAVQWRVENPNGFKDFIKKYNNILNTLEHHGTNP